MSKKTKYEFVAKSWQEEALGSWCFVSLPCELSSEIRNIFKSEEQGWGRLKVIARVGMSEWQTAIWFEARTQSYLLPLKVRIRKEEKIRVGQKIKVLLWV